MTENKSSNPLLLVLGLSAVFFALFLFISGLLYFSKGASWGSGLARFTHFDGKKSAAHLAPSFFSSPGVVGVLELKGVILDSKKTLAKLERLEESDSVKAVVLRLNSPGGAVAPSQEIYEAVKAFKKPLVISMGSVAASGAYYIASGAKSVFANPGTMTGSIGVIMEFMNLEKLYQWAKVDRYSVKSGKFKDIGAEYRQMTPDERTLLETLVQDILSQFREAVVQGRNLKPDHVVRISDGRIFSGRQAKAEGLVDTLGTIQDAINEAGFQAGIQGKPNVYYMDKSKSFIEKLLDDSGEGGESASGKFNLIVNLIKLFGLSDPSHSSEAALELESRDLLQPLPYLLWKGSP